MSLRGAVVLDTRPPARAIALPEYRPRHIYLGGRHTREPAKVHRYQRSKVNFKCKQGARAPSKWGAENPDDRTVLRSPAFVLSPGIAPSGPMACRPSGHFSPPVGGGPRGLLSPSALAPPSLPGRCTSTRTCSSTATSTISTTSPFCLFCSRRLNLNSHLLSSLLLGPECRGGALAKAVAQSFLPFRS